MAKTIVASVTLHVRDDKRSKKAEFDRMTGFQISGKNVLIEVPPETPVAFEDEAEAERLISRGRAKESTYPAVLTVRKRGTDDENSRTEELIPLATKTAEPAAKTAVKAGKADAAV